MSFDLNSPDFWDPQATRKEILRVFEICHGCTLCHTLCPSFVNMFQLVDENFGEVDALKDEQVNHVVDLCYRAGIKERRFLLPIALRESRAFADPPGESL